MICPDERARDMSAFRAVRVGEDGRHVLLPEGRDGAVCAGPEVNCRRRLPQRCGRTCTDAITRKASLRCQPGRPVGIRGGLGSNDDHTVAACAFLDGVLPVPIPLVSCEIDPFML